MQRVLGVRLELRIVSVMPVAPPPGYTFRFPMVYPFSVLSYPALESFSSTFPGCTTLSSYST